MKPQKTASMRGFTLIELMITVAIVGILAAIALPNYNSYVERSHRANARNALVQLAQWMERVATATGSYPVCNATFSSCTTQGPSGPVNLIFPDHLRKVSGERYSDITISDSGEGKYTLAAVPTSAQTNDACGTFTLNHQGARGVRSQPSGSTETGLTCWAR